MGRLLGVDLGTRRIGLALSDPAGTTATPFRTVARSDDDLDAGALAEIAREEGAQEIVLGLPLRLDGTRGSAAEAAEVFAERLRATGLGVHLWDERLTTAEAEKRLRGMEGRRRRQVVDQVAAAVILQSYLDARP